MLSCLGRRKHAQHMYLPAVSFALHCHGLRADLTREQVRDALARATVKQPRIFPASPLDSSISHMNFAWREACGANSLAQSMDADFTGADLSVPPSLSPRLLMADQFSLRANLTPATSRPCGGNGHENHLLAQRRSCPGPLFRFARMWPAFKLGQYAGIQIRRWPDGRPI